MVKLEQFLHMQKDGRFLVQDLISFCSTSINGSSQLEVFCRIGVTKMQAKYQK